MIAPSTDRILCHCLRVTERQVSDAIERNALCSVREVMKCTGAGRGCMSCHSRIKSLLAGERPVSTFAVPGCAGCHNPVCACEAKELVGEAVCLRTETVEVAANVDAATVQVRLGETIIAATACGPETCGPENCSANGCGAICGEGVTTGLSFEAVAAQTLTLATALMSAACAAD